MDSPVGASHAYGRQASSLVPYNYLASCQRQKNKKHTSASLSTSYARVSRLLSKDRTFILTLLHGNEQPPLLLSDNFYLSVIFNFYY